MTKSDYMAELHKANTQANQLTDLVRRYVAMHDRASNGRCDCKVCEDARTVLL